MSASYKFILNVFTTSEQFLSFRQSTDRGQAGFGGGTRVRSGGERKAWFYQTAEDEEDHEQAPQCGFCIDIPIAHCGHCHHQQVDTFPVGE